MPSWKCPARLNRSAGMALDDERGDAQIAEQQGARQPDQAPADDQHRCLLLRHVRLLALRCGDAIRANGYVQLSVVMAVSPRS